MIQVCAWCEQEGRHNILTQKSEYSLGQVSHGICPTHALRLRHGYRRRLVKHSAATPSARPHSLATFPSSS